jgi:hypothetical protein
MASDTWCQRPCVRRQPGRAESCALRFPRPLSPASTTSTGVNAPSSAFAAPVLAHGVRHIAAHAWRPTGSSQERTSMNRSRPRFSSPTTASRVASAPASTRPRGSPGRGKAAQAPVPRAGDQLLHPLPPPGTLSLKRRRGNPQHHGLTRGCPPPLQDLVVLPMPQARRFEGFQHSQVDVSSEPEPRKVDERALREIIRVLPGEGRGSGARGPSRLRAPCCLRGPWDVCPTLAGGPAGAFAKGEACGEAASEGWRGMNFPVLSLAGLPGATLGLVTFDCGA